MKKQLEQLKEFHKAVTEKTGFPVLNQQFIAGGDAARLRQVLIDEEADEVYDAFEKGVKSELLKELCDLLYVIYGTAVTFSWPLEQAFDEVHANNMLKLNTGHLGENGKFIKAKDHPKVDLNPLLEKQAEPEVAEGTNV